jgi:pyruvate kinase
LPLPIIAATHDPSTYRQLAMLWGVFPMLVPETTSGEHRIAALIAAAQEHGWIKPGQTIAIATAPTVGTAGGTSGFRIEKV